MKIKQIALVLSMIFSFFYFPGASYAEQETGDRELILSGSGISSSGFDTTSVAVDAQFGQFWSKALEFGFRQNVGFADTEETSRLNGATRIFSDYHFDFNAWQPFIGASLGVQYGAGVSDAFIIGPEIGVKYYVKEKTFITGRVSYLFDVDEDVDDGSTFYTLGIGFNF
ncbi:conserved hypothetical protein [Nitrosococcus halophilus Nc 4]|uniref:Outer membrane protein beta-barrel domain-containing protein n=1 Tax=Nitrosococcus halophilus (strain Nc4) TaxID=472759 RepID=D5C1S0_NITHN|nr:hypothetical protein [Nitrosococcus halophilus]ADE14703.1 conserved hypothetical protein [Nitrosococcus halophilus Nc 4]